MDKALEKGFMYYSELSSENFRRLPERVEWTECKMNIKYR